MNNQIKLVFTIIFISAAQVVYAADPISDAFSAGASIFKSVLNVLIYQWGYYIGTALLAWRAIEVKQGRSSLQGFMLWGLGIIVIFYAPNIVAYFRSGALAGGGLQ